MSFELRNDKFPLIKNYKELPEEKQLELLLGHYIHFFLISNYVLNVKNYDEKAEHLIKGNTKRLTFKEYKVLNEKFDRIQSNINDLENDLLPLRRSITFLDIYTKIIRIVKKF